MTDREKVVNGIEHCKRESEHIYDNPCVGCPYSGEYKCTNNLLEDALALLKEQQKEIEERTNEAAAYAELLIKYGYEFTKRQQ